MPPRYAYWTILVDEQPTAFRAGSQEDLKPTFKRLKEKHASARMVWFQNGKVWNSRLDAQEAMRARGEMGRRGDVRQIGGGFRDRERSGERQPREQRDASGKLEWKPKDPSASSSPRPQASRPHGAKRDGAHERPEWNPKDTRRSSAAHVKGTFAPHPRGDRRPPKPGPGKLEWKPKGTFDSEGRAPRTKPYAPNAKPKSPGARPQAPGFKPQARARQGDDQRRDKTWRPGGEHRDPRQKYKDAKKAKWTRFKQNIRKRWETKQDGPKKRRDEE
jgi:hypothetical protein